MSSSRRQFLAASSVGLLGSRYLSAWSTESSPAPFGAVPNANQLAWHELETYSFLHFTVNTFTDREWGLGDEDPKIFHPTNFDADAIVQDLKQSGMKAVILTCKHHDGFCLWPTKTTEHCIRNSDWKDGKGDVVREISEAARRHGLRFGVYVSPWDRNNPHYATPEYLPIYHQQITELLTNYGPIFEVWFDGANGGDGYYGGAREKRTIDKTTYYQWSTIYALVRRLQPHAVIFGDHADIRWIGNEKGVANPTCWATFTEPDKPGVMGPRDSEAGREQLQGGIRNGKEWTPPECDVSIRPGWFYHDSQNSKVRTPQNLLDLYFKSVGRGGSLLLNFPPNREGRIPAQDAASGAAFYELLEKLFQTNLAATASLKPSSVRDNAKRYNAQRLVDKNPSTYWSSEESVHTPEVEITLAAPGTVGVIRLREAIALGQRIGSIAVDVWQQNAWKQIATATSIGPCRLIQLETPVTAQRFRLRITSSEAAVALTELGLYAPLPA